MRVRVFNLQIISESMCCAGFGGLLLYLLLTEKYLSYVTPRMTGYLYFTAAILFIWAFAGIFRPVYPQRRMKLAPCLVLVIPALLLLLPHKPLSASELSAAYTGSFIAQTKTPAADSSNQGKADDAPSAAQDSGASSQNQETYDASAQDQRTANDPVSDTEIPDAGLSGFDPVHKTITIDNEEVYQWLTELYTNVDQYEGYTVSVTGFIYKDPQFFKADEFLPARLCMTCCTADLTPIGLVCKYGDVASLKENSWVTVEGILEKGQYDGESEPQLSVTKITPAEEVADYVYPY